MYDSNIRNELSYASLTMFSLRRIKKAIMNHLMNYLMNKLTQEFFPLSLGA